MNTIYYNTIIIYTILILFLRFSVITKKTLLFQSTINIINIIDN